MIYSLKIAGSNNDNNNNYNNNNNDYLGVKSYLAGQRPTNWGHHFYHSKLDGDLSHDRHTHKLRSLRGSTV